MFLLEYIELYYLTQNILFHRLNIANLARDEQLLKFVREVARGVIEADPQCDNPQYRVVWDRLRNIKRMNNWNWGAIS